MRMVNFGRKDTTFRAYTCAKIVVFCVNLIIHAFISTFFTIAHKKNTQKIIFICIFQKNAVPLQPISVKIDGRGGGIGRHEGLKILWPVMAVRVQVPPAVLKKKARFLRGSCFFLYIILRTASLLHFAYSRRICNKRWVYWPFGCSLLACSTEKIPVLSIFSTFTLPEQCTTLSASNKIPT